MPQLDKLIFFTENLGFCMSFFGLVFYNQYFFYPQLLKSLFIRRQLILKNVFQNVIKLFLKFNLNFIINFDKIKNLQNFYFNFYEISIKKIYLYMKFKLKNSFYLINLFINKFIWTFTFFYEVYRTFIEEYDYVKSVQV